MIHVDDNKHGLGESSVFIADDHLGEEGDRNGVVIHPWDRTSDWDKSRWREVFVSVGYFTDDKGEKEFQRSGDPQQFSWAFIADREEFIEGLLAVFPELKRAD